MRKLNQFIMHNEQLTTKEKEMNCSVDDSIAKGIKEIKLEQEGKIKLNTLENLITELDNQDI